MSTEDSRLADDIVRSMQQEPARWGQHAVFDQIVRDDGVAVWKDGSGLYAPRQAPFSAQDQRRVVEAIETWQMGPLRAHDEPEA